MKLVSSSKRRRQGSSESFKSRSAHNLLIDFEKTQTPPRRRGILEVRPTMTNIGESKQVRISQVSLDLLDR